jgi:hypothetical protein
LQAGASRVIARVTGAEAGIVTSGASAALLLGAAACLAGLDPARMNRLPEVPDGRNEIIIVRSQRNMYDRALTVAGGRIVEVGIPDRYSGPGVRDAAPWEIEAAITPRTAAICYLAQPQSRPALAEVATVAHAHALPVLVDAAAQLPPKDNLRRFLADGADLVAFSGGKAIGGPQASGILAGRADLIASALMQMLDLDLFPIPGTHRMNSPGCASCAACRSTASGVPARWARRKSSACWWRWNASPRPTTRHGTPPGATFCGPSSPRRMAPRCNWRSSTARYRCWNCARPTPPPGGPPRRARSTDPLFGRPARGECAGDLPRGTHNGPGHDHRRRAARHLKEDSAMRLFSATIATETNTFSPMPTSLDHYKESVFYRPGEHPTDAPRMCTAPLFVARQRAAAEGFTLIEGSCFAASPAGTTNRADYEFMRDEILAQVKAALPLDGVLLGLHGAMVAHGYDDTEGDVIERMRALVGRTA